MTKGRKSDYSAYKKYYNELKDKMKKQGYQMAEKMYSKQEWQAYHTAMKNDRKKLVAEGKRKLVGNINRDLAANQQWTYSTKQAKAQAKSMKLRGTKTKDLPKIKDIRAGKITVNFNEIHLQELALKNAGYSMSDIKKIISQEYFGS